MLEPFLFVCVCVTLQHFFTKVDGAWFKKVVHFFMSGIIAGEHSGVLMTGQSQQFLTAIIDRLLFVRTSYFIKRSV